RRSSGGGVSVGLIFGAVALGVFLLGGVIVAGVFLLKGRDLQQAAARIAKERNPQAQDPAAPAPNAAPDVKPQAGAAAPADKAEWDVTLSNARFILEMPHSRFLVDYRFNRGGPAPGTTYILMIESERGHAGKVQYNWNELADMGTFRVESLGGGMG